MKNILFTAALLATTAIITSCASMGGHYDADRAKNVKKVAIIGYEILQSMPTDNMGIGKMLDYKEHDGVNNATAIQTMATSAYNDFGTKLAQTTSWKVMTYEDIIKNKTYAAKVEKAMTGIRQVNFGAGQEGKTLITAKGMLDVTAARKMEAPDRAALAKALGVDAVAELMVINTIDQPWMSFGHVSGDASFEYFSRLNFAVFEPTNESPVWRIQNVDGEKYSSKNLPEKMIRMDKISKASLSAHQSAATKLTQQYPTAAK